MTRGRVLVTYEQALSREELCRVVGWLDADVRAAVSTTQRLRAARNRALIGAGFLAGVALAPALGLRWRQLRGLAEPMGAHLIEVPGHHGPRTIPLPELGRAWFVALLEAVRHDSGPPAPLEAVFTCPRVPLGTVAGAHQVLERVANGAGIRPLTVGRVVETYRATLLATGCPPAVMAYLLDGDLLDTASPEAQVDLVRAVRALSDRYLVILEEQRRNRVSLHPISGESPLSAGSIAEQRELTLEELLDAARVYHLRGDAMGLYRFVRERIDEAANDRHEGMARALLAEIMILWGLGSPVRLGQELERTRSLLQPHPAEQAYAIMQAVAWRATEGDVEGVVRLQAEYDRLCVEHPQADVQRWRGRISSWRGRLAVSRSQLDEAIDHYARSISEYEQFEPDLDVRQELIRSSRLNLAKLALRVGKPDMARVHLDQCEGPFISRLWETVRACTEVELAIQVGDTVHMLSWMHLAHRSATSQPEALTILTLTQARVAYAQGDLGLAARLTADARCLAAQHKQDVLLRDIHKFTAALRRGEGVGSLPRGGVGRDIASNGPVDDGGDPAGDVRRRRCE